MVTSHLRTFSVLVVEDDLLTSVAVCKAICVGIPDALVLSAYSLAEARLLMEEYTVNCFILDVNLPDGSGIDFIFDVMVKNPEATIVLITSTPLPEYRDRAEAFGVMHFMTKPLHYDSLVAVIQESRALLPGATQEETSLFSVALSRLAVLDIIQLKCLGNATEAMDFRSAKQGSGRIYFENGNIIHAETARAKGMAALSEIIGWKGGCAEEVQNCPATERTILGHWQGVLLIAAQALDEK